MRFLVLLTIIITTVCSIEIASSTESKPEATQEEQLTTLPPLERSLPEIITPESITLGWVLDNFNEHTFYHGCHIKEAGVFPLRKSEDNMPMWTCGCVTYRLKSAIQSGEVPIEPEEFVKWLSKQSRECAERYLHEI